MEKYPETPDLSIKVGDRVRSYDFVDMTSCYYEGYVDGIINGYYKIVVARRVLDGAERKNFVETIHAPVNGRPGLFGLTRGVVKVNTFKAR